MDGYQSSSRYIFKGFNVFHEPIVFNTMGGFTTFMVKVTIWTVINYQVGIPLLVDLGKLRRSLFTRKCENRALCQSRSHVRMTGNTVA